MAYDLLIKNGWVVDGSGLPRFRADVGVNDGRISAIGRLRESAKEVIDAEGRVVAPGFVDGHTHMDAQIFWDPLGTSSCWHGITSVVMGNCALTLAPCKPEGRNALVDTLALVHCPQMEGLSSFLLVYDYNQFIIKKTAFKRALFFLLSLFFLRFIF